MIGDWSGWADLTLGEQYAVISYSSIGALSGLVVAVLFGWSPRRPTPKKRKKRKRGRR
jgi:hypothetical protein